MSEPTLLAYNVVESKDPDGGLRYALVVDGRQTATASASYHVLKELERTLGVRREQVRADLVDSLVRLLSKRLDKVVLFDLTPDGQNPLRYHARFTYRDMDHVEMGAAWYDVASSETGPSDVPAIVLNRLRSAVHIELTTEGSSARALAALHEPS